jgi:hypothetical protein
MYTKPYIYIYIYIYLEILHVCTLCLQIERGGEGGRVGKKDGQTGDREMETERDRKRRTESEKERGAG